ncbi:MAG TPA: DUF305 domain-containing protein [Gemmatimonadales bacterium]|nr:DUF305 domain-containing protein [Gemmatimonadales bacterium]
MLSFPIRLAGACLAATVFAAPAALAQAATTAALPPYVPADAEFMTGMIGHHAQAVLISEWAPTHGASPGVLRLTERIVVGQADEIFLMETWLRDRGEPVPDPSHAGMPGMDHSKHMPGMLNAEQLDTLSRAQGAEFDRLFLTYMIQHHLGAVVMVNELFATPGAGQDEATFRMASNIYADQTTEIARMEKMLAALAPPAGAGPS